VTSVTSQDPSRFIHDIAGTRPLDGVTPQNTGRFYNRLSEWNSAMTSMMPSRGSDGQGFTGRYAQRAFDRARTGGALAASRMDA